MDYVCAIFVLLSVQRIVWSNVASQCQVPPASLNLADLQGEVSYNGTFRHDDCSWNLPEVNATEHVLLIYLEDLHLIYHDGPISGCSGKLILPETAPFCQMPASSCFLYSTPESICTFSEITKTAKNVSSNCSSLLWLNVDLLPRAMRVKASAPDYKKFTLRYKFSSCKKLLEERNSPAGTPTLIDKQTPTPDKGNRTDESTTQSYETALVAVCIAFAIVLLLLVLVSFCTYKKYIRPRSDKPRTSSPEFTAGTRIPSNQYESQAQEAGFNGNMAINEYEEISTERFSSNSREVVRNSLY